MVEMLASTQYELHSARASTSIAAAASVSVVPVSTSKAPSLPATRPTATSRIGGRVRYVCSLNRSHQNLKH
jgi:hypothetical protein